MSYALRGGGRDSQSTAGAGKPRAAGEFGAGGPAVDITALFRRHYPELVRLAVMLVGDRPTAEDVVQDVFARLHARRDRPGPRGDQLAYVRACVLNGCRSALQRRARRGRLAGRVAGLSLVNGGLLRGLQGGNALAVSPDGSKAALTVYRPVRFGQPDLLEIAVINLRTGGRGYWAGGLDRPGFHLSIPSISWGPGNDSLVFLSQWCRAMVTTGFCGPGTPVSQVRTLPVAGGGGRLSAGGVLLGRPTGYTNIVQALLAPDGKALDIVTLTGPYRGKPHPVPQILLLARVPLSRGGRAMLLYHGVTGPNGAVFLSSDASGRYLLLTWRRNGWIDHGRLRPLAAPPGAFTGAW